MTASIPAMKPGDVLGHEFMGEVVDIGRANERLQKGQRVVVPFTISCGKCFFCEYQQFSACDNSTSGGKGRTCRRQRLRIPCSGLFGYSHLTGGYWGGQAEYVRVPFANVGPIVVPDGLDDDKVLFLSDILPTGWMAAENCDIEEGDTVAVWGCGPGRPVRDPERAQAGGRQGYRDRPLPAPAGPGPQLGAEVARTMRQVHVHEALLEMTGGIGPDAVIDAVGMESHGFSIDNVIDRAKQTVMLATERPHALRRRIAWRAARAGAFRCRASMAALPTPSRWAP